MRTPEARQWRYLRDQMAGHWHVQRHEDKHSEDIPDVSFAARGVDGFLELKTLAKWPVKPNTPVRIAHLTGGQVNWMEERGAAGNGHVYLLLAIGGLMNEAEWFLVPYTRVRSLYEGAFIRDDFHKIFSSSTGRGLSDMIKALLRYNTKAE